VETSDIGPFFIAQKESVDEPTTSASFNKMIKAVERGSGRLLRLRNTSLRSENAMQITARDNISS
jgi:hypothetical protein